MEGKCSGDNREKVTLGGVVKGRSGEDPSEAMCPPSPQTSLRVKLRPLHRDQQVSLETNKLVFRDQQVSKGSACVV